MTHECAQSPVALHTQLKGRKRLAQRQKPASGLKGCSLCHENRTLSSRGRGGRRFCTKAVNGHPSANVDGRRRAANAANATAAKTTESMRTKGVMAIFKGDRGAAKLIATTSTSRHVAFSPRFWCFSQRAMGEPRAKTEKKGGRTSSGQAKMAAKEIRPEGAVVVERRNDVRARFLLKSWLSPLVATEQMMINHQSLVGTIRRKLPALR